MAFGDVYDCADSSLSLNILNNNNYMGYLSTSSSISHIFSVMLNKKMELVAKQVFNKLNKLKLKTIFVGNRENDTLLTFACENYMESFALDILEFPREANITHTKQNGDTAFTIAHKNKMFGIASIINSFEENGATYETEKIKKKQQHWDKLHESIKTSCKNGSCVYCMEENSKYNVISPCMHIVGVCADCEPEFKKSKKCMVCMKIVGSVQPAYVVE